MNRQELMKRWILGYVQPELFYYPMKKKTGLGEPMIIEVEILDHTKVFNIIRIRNPEFYYTNISFVLEDHIEHFDINLKRFNNLRTQEDILIDKTNFPQYFNNLPYNKSNDGLLKISSFSENLCSDYNDLSIIINWGDGEEDVYNNVLPYNVPLSNGETLKYDSNVVLDVYSFLKPHQYSKNGTYFIKIWGKIPQLSLYPIDNYELNTNSILYKGIVQWGDLDLIAMPRFFSIISQYNYMSEDFYFPEYIQSLSNVLDISYMFQYFEFNKFKNFNYDCIKIFRKALVANHTFEYSDINYISRHFLQNNNMLMIIQFMFGYTPIEYIEDYAFSNLDNLYDATSICSNTINLKRIGESIFENNVNMNICRRPFEGSENVEVIGNYTFRNCKSIAVLNDVFALMSNLVSVGNGTFENCEHLEMVGYAFYDCRKLVSIGNNTFKNCYNLHYLYGLHRNNFSLSNIPDNYLYDLKYNPEYTYNISFAFAFYYSLNFRAYQISGYNPSNQMIRPNEITQTEYDTWYKGRKIPLGKNMFSAEFLTSLNENIGEDRYRSFAEGTFNGIIGKFIPVEDIEKLENIGNGRFRGYTYWQTRFANMQHLNPLYPYPPGGYFEAEGYISGEAPPLWEYLTNARIYNRYLSNEQGWYNAPQNSVFGCGNLIAIADQYSEERINYVVYTCKSSYDNINEISGDVIGGVSWGGKRAGLNWNMYMSPDPRYFYYL